MQRALGGLSLLALVFGTGCDLAAKPFAGTLLQMSISGAEPLPPDEHLEFWARTANDDIVRISTIYEHRTRGRIRTNVQTGQLCPEGADPNTCTDPRGFLIVPAITFADPCMIDEQGNLLTTAAAWEPTVVNNTPQTPEELAAQLRVRISQVTAPTNCDTATPPHCGRQMHDLYGLISYTPTTLAPLNVNPSAAERLAKCTEMWKDPLAYTPNPFQLPAPLNGPIWGFVSFTTVTPPSGFDTFRLDIPFKLKGIKELFVTIENHSAARKAMFPPDGVNAKDRGPIYLQGFPEVGGVDAVSFTMAGATASAHVSLYVNLDEDPVQF
jgi:hypothetical protein